mgnify:CR=1 FL=1
MNAVEVLREPARDVKVVAQADVLVVGGGPGRHGRCARGRAQRRIDRAARTL